MDNPDTIDPRQPCPYAPGSEEKILWLTARAGRRLPLFNPLDATGARRLNRVGPSRPPRKVAVGLP
jgi:hypothetical protein